jgi:tetratricopeptide (TPR) repeat protein
MGWWDGFRAQRACRAQARAAFAKGSRHASQARWADAEAAFGEASELVPDSRRYRLHLGRAQFEHGEFTAAIDTLREGDWIYGTSANFIIGSAFARLGDLDQSNAYLAKAARWGHAKARATLNERGFDACPNCACLCPLAPTDEEPDVGLAWARNYAVHCPDCGSRQCWRCAAIGPYRSEYPTCDMCGSRLRPVTLGQPS